MAWVIKIKVGIFKTQEYRLSVLNQKIILEPQAEGYEVLTFTQQQINSISLMRKNTLNDELELVTSTGMYVGTVSRETDSREISSVLTQVFGAKFSRL